MHRAPSIRTASRLTGFAIIVAIVGAACSSSDSSGSETTAEASTETSSETTAETTPDTTAAPTTPPPTTVPETTVPETTAPPSTMPSTTAPPTSFPQASDEEIAQFCFQSEQVFVASVVMSELDQATPAEAEAATSFMASAIDTAVLVAPPEFADEPLAAQAAMTEFVEIAERNGYDPDAIMAGPDGERATELVGEINLVMESLVEFLREVCDTRIGVLESQGVKLADVVVEASTWSVLAVTNVAGDIRLLVPTDWTDWIGSVDVEEITFLQASPDNAQFDANWDVPGVVATVAYVEAGIADPTARLDLTLAATECTPTTSEMYADAVYSGGLYLFEACAGGEAGAAVALVTDVDQSVETILEFQFPGAVDRAIVDQVLAGFAAGA